VHILLVTTDFVIPGIWGCPASFHQYSDRGLTYTRVNWTAPTATDNLDTSVTVSLTTGSAPGSIFYESLVPYTIRYDAQDSAGNAALPCIFTIIISGMFTGDATLFSSLISTQFSLLLAF
jgi:hypothetical protein